MTDPAIDAAHLRSWVGASAEAVDTVTPGLLGRFGAAFDLPASAADAAPPGLHWCLSPASAPTGELGADGHPERGGFLPPVPLPRRMWAGGEVEFRRSLRVGEAVRRSSTIADVAAKQGRTGALCFVVVRHGYRASGEIAIVERQDIVFRGAEAGRPAAAAPASAPTAALHTRRLTPSPVLLFRYSALTYNGHRIHYDRSYAREREGYPALVVHGPLQATLLLHFAAALRGGACPARFAFRSVAPAFDDADLMLNADPDGGGLALWTAAPGGPPAMRAEAAWDR